MIVSFIIAYILSASFNLAMCINHYKEKGSTKDFNSADVVLIFMPFVNVIVAIAIIIYDVMLAISLREKKKEGAKK